MAYRKKTGGRKIGTPNKVSADLKAMIMEALHEAGGKDYLIRQAKTNDTSFNTLLGKVLPLSLSPEGNGKMTITWEK